MFLGQSTRKSFQSTPTKFTDMAHTHAPVNKAIHPKINQLDVLFLPTQNTILRNKSNSPSEIIFCHWLQNSCHFVP
jgi:hypothetical protein